MKTLLLGILTIVLVGIGGLVYRNATEHPLQPIACPLDALICPDGTSVARTGPSCVFPACPPPNVSLSDVGIAFAIPTNFTEAEIPDAASIVAYALPTTASSTNGYRRRFGASHRYNSLLFHDARESPLHRCLNGTF